MKNGNATSFVQIILIPGRCLSLSFPFCYEQRPMSYGCLVSYALCPMRLQKKEMKRKTIRENNKQTNVVSVLFFSCTFFIRLWMNGFISLIPFPPSFFYWHWFISPIKKCIIIFSFSFPNQFGPQAQKWTLVQSIICHLLFGMTVTALRFVSAFIVWKNDILSCDLWFGWFWFGERHCRWSGWRRLMSLMFCYESNGIIKLHKLCAVSEIGLCLDNAAIAGAYTRK